MQLPQLLDGTTDRSLRRQFNSLEAEPYVLSCVGLQELMRPVMLELPIICCKNLDRRKCKLLRLSSILSTSDLYCKASWLCIMSMYILHALLPVLDFRVRSENFSARSSNLSLSTKSHPTIISSRLTTRKLSRRLCCCSGIMLLVSSPANSHAEVSCT